MANFDLSMLALKGVCPNNTIEVDDTDLPSVLVYIPAFKNSDVLTGGNDSIHPAFIVNGQQISGFYYSKYQNVVHAAINTEGYNVTAAYSLPGEDPAANINFDTARSRCEAKGHGWHLSTNAEWAAIALWCKKNGFMPYGNNNYGKDTRESNYKAIPTYKDSDGRTCRVGTGTGPLTWSHDKTLGGIWDLNGNVWEWQSGIRFVWGELQILANNDAADPDNPQNETSVCWKAINAADGSLVDPECSVSGSAKLSGNTVKLDYVSSKWTYSTTISSLVDQSRSCLFANVTCTAAIGAATKVLLRSLALLPDEGAVEADYEGDYYWLNNGVAERCVIRGGYWNSGASAGVFYFSGDYSRAYVNTGVGFRSAYIPEVIG